MLSLLQFLKTPVRQPKLGWCIAAILTVHVLSTQLVLRGMRTVKGGGDGMAGMANAIPLFYTLAAPHHFAVISHECISPSCTCSCVRVRCNSYNIPRLCYKAVLHVLSPRKALSIASAPVIIALQLTCFCRKMCIRDHLRQSKIPKGFGGACHQTPLDGVLCARGGLRLATPHIRH